MKTTSNTTSTSHTPVIPHKAHCDVIDFGFGEGWGAARDALKLFADKDPSTDPEGRYEFHMAAKVAITILDSFEVNMRNNFKPEDCIVSDGEKEGDSGEDF